MTSPSREQAIAFETDDRNAAGEGTQKKATAAAEELGSQARGFVEQQKATGAEQIGDVADAMKSAANDLQGKMPLAAEYVEDVAERLDAVASTLRERSVDEMVGKVRDFARKQPAMFFAGAVATGFALSRFLKSSASNQG